MYLTEQNQVTDLATEKKSQYNPYMNNMGTVMTLAGKDFVILCGDKRLSMGYAILSHDSTKIQQLTDKVFIASSGMYADVKALWKNLRARIEIYRSTHKRDPDLPQIANLLSITLYMRRFFPYYAFNVLAGMKENGEFTCYGYDAVGSFDEVQYGAQGSGNELVTPVLDNIMGRKKNEGKDIEVKEAYDLIRECMNGTSCRDIYTGDKMDIVILHKDGRVDRLEEDLRKD
jgi:20S proteasome subunit beta 6